MRDPTIVEELLISEVKSLRENNEKLTGNLDRALDSLKRVAWPSTRRLSEAKRLALIGLKSCGYDPQTVQYIEDNLGTKGICAE